MNNLRIMQEHWDHARFRNDLCGKGDFAQSGPWRIYLSSFWTMGLKVYKPIGK